LNSCTIGDHVYVGANATVASGAVLENGSMVAAGAHVPAGVTVPSGQVWAGSPAKFLRHLSAVEKENLREQHHEYSKLAEIHSERRE
jgi:carbonic anhydrase/acetyltransferase-like protein (isoleucine patch superfamily)